MALTAAQLVARLTADTSGFYRGMAVANSAMIRSGSIISRVAAGAGLATLGIGIASLRSAGNFEQSMNILQAVSGATQKQFGNLRQEAVDLGADMKLPNVSAKDAADAMQELAKGGLSVGNILKATRGTLQLGLAANIGFADSATIVARALQAFHLEGTQATKVADLFTAAANKSTADMTDIALGFQMASAQFQAGDQSIQGLTTSLALMANAGIVGSDAGTSLKTMMNRLMAPTAKASKLMKSLGIDVYDANGNMKPMPALIDEFNHGMANMSKEQKNAALYTIFGSDAIRAARVQMNAGSKGWERMERAITKGGEAQKFAEARTKGLNGALQAFGSVAETLAINLGSAMLPAATALVRTFTAWLAAIDPNKIIAFFSAITDGIGTIYRFISGSDALTAALAGAFATLLAYKTIMLGIRVATLAWAAANYILEGSFLAALSLPALIVAALVGLAIALVVFYKKSEQFRDIVNAAFNSVKSVVLAVVSAILSAWNSLSSATSAVWSKIGSTVIAVANNLRSALTAAFNAYKAIILAVWGVIEATTTAAWNIIKAIVTNAIGVITGKISAMTALRNIISAIWNGVRAVTIAQWNLIKTTVRTAVTEIPKILLGIVGSVAAAAAAIGSAIMQGILSGVSGLAGALAGKVTGAIHSALGSVKGAFGIHSPSATTQEEIGKPLGEGIVTGFLLGTADLPDKVRKTVETALEGGRKKIEAYQSIYQEAFGKLASDAMSAFDAITAKHLTPTEAILKREEDSRAAERLRQNLTEAQTALDKIMADPEATGADAAAALQKVYDAEWEIRKVALEKKAEQERLDYEASRTLQKTHLDAQLSNLETALAKHPERHKFYQEKILKLLASYGITYKASGLVLGRAFATGLREAFDDVERSAKAIAELVARYLRLRSPAAEGPLSDLDSWWSKFASTLVSGLDTAPIRSASATMAGAVGPSPWAGGALGVSAPAVAGAGAGSTYVNQYYVEGSLVLESQLEDVVHNSLLSKKKKVGDLGLAS